MKKIRKKRLRRIKNKINDPNQINFFFHMITKYMFWYECDEIVLFIFYHHTIDYCLSLYLYLWEHILLRYIRLII